MADVLDTIRPGPNFEFHLVIRRLVDSSGNKALPDGKIARDVAIAHTIWRRTAGISIVADSIKDFVSDYYFSLYDFNHYKELKAEFWKEGQTWINVFYVSTSSFRPGQCSATNHDEHGIYLTDAASDDWRGITLGHEIGHYVDLFHTKSNAADCPDIDKTNLDPGNMMAQGVDGRTDVPGDIHLTSCQVYKARDTCFARRPYLITPHYAAVMG